jgi:hypothetical protein
MQTPEKRSWKTIKRRDSKKLRHMGDSIRKKETLTKMVPWPEYVSEWQEMIGPMESFIQKLKKALGPKNFIREEE